MALVLNIDVCVASDCKSLNVSESTGAYSASNLGGWGAPNPLIANATTALLLVVNPAGVSYSIDLLATTFFPNINSSYLYSVPLTSIGLTATNTITDGNWVFTYYIVASAVIYTKTISKLYYCNSKCCVQTLLATLDPSNCDCNKANTGVINTFNTANAFLLALIDASNCGQVDKFNAIKLVVDKLCLNKGCKNCNS